MVRRGDALTRRGPQPLPFLLLRFRSKSARFPASVSASLATFVYAPEPFGGRKCGMSQLTHEAAGLSGPGSERRRAARHRALKKGEILFNDGYSGIDCLIRNISDTGALLITQNPVGIPARFNLKLEAPRPLRRCELRWRGADRIGVRFDDDE